MPIDSGTITQAAAQLAEAERSRVPVTPLSSQYPEFSVDDAYAVQLENVNRRQRAGEPIVGRKIGLTSKVMQEMLGVDEPDYGALFAAMLFDDGASIAHDRFIQPRAEVEIAFRLRAPLPIGEVTVSDVLSATEAVAPSIEIIDSRIADWKITLADTIADNASSAGVVLGEFVPLAPGMMLEEIAAKLLVNGSEVSAGRGADVLGHPAAAVAWLANKLAGFGVELAAGDIVMPGSCTKAIDIGLGDEVRAEFSSIGSVTFSLLTA